MTLPVADLAPSTPADLAGGRSVTGMKTASAQKAASQGAREFRDLLGSLAAWNQTGKGEGGQATVSTAVPQRQNAVAQPSVAVASTWQQSAWDKASVDETSAVPESEFAEQTDDNAPPVAAAIEAADGAALALASALAAGASAAVGPPREGCGRSEPEGAPASRDDVDLTILTASGRQTAEPAALRAVDDRHAQASMSVDAASVDPAISPSCAAADEDVQLQAVDEAVEFRPTMPARVAVVAQETHFAPVTIGSAVDQIADVLVRELPALTDQVAPMAVDTPVDRSPARTLTIQLDPPKLGEVTVTLRLKGDGLALSVSASDHDTARMLHSERDRLSDLMRESGYDADITSVQVADVDTMPSGQGPQSGSSQGRQETQPGLAEGRRHPPPDQRTNGQGERQEQESSTSRRPHSAASDTVTAVGSAIYL